MCDVVGIVDCGEIAVGVADIVVGLHVAVAEFIRPRKRIDNPLVPQPIFEAVANEFTPVLIDLILQQ